MSQGQKFERPKNRPVLIEAIRPDSVPIR